jgi:4-amino-4-deoxy-L-arabinose transferase-like glycosyltransferase
VEAEESNGRQNSKALNRGAATMVIIVLGLTALLFFARLGARALWSSEFRWAEIAREMTVTGNYFWPTINGRLYYDKPLLSYWFVLAATGITGALNEEAARIPCAAAGLLGVAFLILLARRLWDWRTGALAGFILATSMSFVFFSRHASADVETVTGELAALLLFASKRETPSSSWVIPLWLIMAITSLTKGLLGFALPLLVFGVYSVVVDGWKELYDKLGRGALKDRWKWLVAHNRWFFNWSSIPAIAIAAGVYAAPFVVSQMRMSSEAGLYMVYRENVLRFFHPFDHRGPVYLYTYVIFALMAPWSALLPAALAETHHTVQMSGERQRSDRFVLVYFWATFVFFTLSGSRRSYYLLPILPAGALLVARVLLRQRKELSPAARHLLDLGYGALVVAVIAGAALLLPPAMRPSPWNAFPPTPARMVFAIFWVIAAASVLYAAWNYRTASVAMSFAVVAYLGMTYLYVVAMPAADAYRTEKPFAATVVRELHGNFSTLSFFRTQGPLFYLAPPKPIPQFDKAAAFRAAIGRDGLKWVIVRRRDFPLLRVPSTIVLRETTFPWEGAQAHRNKQLLVNIASDSVADKGGAGYSRIGITTYK